ncbi:hypothetical protein B1R38_27030 [Bacillus cereus]|uniref:hypothetical protein n=1 Tax=Bacillus cereus TaxID=1396 RepID=UPI000D6550CD|nr:hypothetical protein [Bacillus cereus]PWE70243.1 hypothetical protein B1R38_27030 [Bacillus cereus]
MVNLMIKLFFYLNIVEWVKKLSDYFTKLYFNSHNDQTKWIKVRRNRNIAIDIFILLKYLFILFILFNDINNMNIQMIVWYLIISNVFTYFYYHLWCEDALLDRHLTINRVRRKFINLFISIGFMMLSYVYLYYSQTPEHFTIGNKHENNKYLIFFINSITRSFAINYDSLKSSDDIGVAIEISQVLNMFIFVTLIVAKSLPKANSE